MTDGMYSKLTFDFKLCNVEKYDLNYIKEITKGYINVKDDGSIEADLSGGREIYQSELDKMPLSIEYEMFIKMYHSLDDIVSNRKMEKIEESGIVKRKSFRGDRLRRLKVLYNNMNCYFDINEYCNLVGVRMTTGSGDLVSYQYGKVVCVVGHFSDRPGYEYTVIRDSVNDKLYKDEMLVIKKSEIDDVKEVTDDTEESKKEELIKNEEGE